MKGVLFSVLLVATLCAAVVFGAASAPASTCPIPDASWNLYAVQAADFNTTDRWGKMQVNLCQDIEKECAKSAGEPCSVCQWLDENSPNFHSFCVAYSRNEKYYNLNSTTYPNTAGATVELLGDPCGDRGDRKTFIDILCNQPNTSVAWISEEPTCTYNFVMFVQGDCKPNANSFTPTFTIPTITSSSITVVIDDGYPWQYWSYTVELNGVVAYQGTERWVVIEDLKSGTSYNVVVNRVSGSGAAMTITSPSVSQTVKTLSFSSHFVTISGTGSGIAIGMLITLAVLAVVVGVWKFVLPKIRGEDKKGFSLVDAEKSTAFD